MKSRKIHSQIIDVYLKMISGLNFENKLELISKLTFAMQKENKKEGTLKGLYGAWQDDKTAEQLMNELRDDRAFTQNRPSL